MLCCVYLSIYRIIRCVSSFVDHLESALNLSHHHHHHHHHPHHPCSILLPRVLSQLQLKVFRKQDELLMLLNRMNFEGKVVRTGIKMQG